MTTAIANRRGTLTVCAAFLVVAAVAAHARAQAGGDVKAQALASGQGAAVEVLREIRVHGNYTTADAEVTRLAGLALGQPLPPSAIADARVRLERSGRFVAIDLRKRYRSLDDPTDVALVIVVQEYPVPDATPAPLRPLRRTFGSAMFMPVLNFTDGYGLTYGGRVSFVEGLGRASRLSVPFTWGGSKRVAAEFERPITGGSADAITATLSLSRRTNPRYEIDDDRHEATLGAWRAVAGPLRVGGHVGFTTVGFGNLSDRFVQYGANAVLDTRADPSFPRNAVYVAAGLDHLAFRQTAPANRLRVDARGYVGLVGQAVLSARVQTVRADVSLPPYERLLLGGSDSLRGYRAGTFDGDSVLAGSLELRIPTSSPLSFARSGVDVFADVGTAWDHGARFRDAVFHPGFGGGVFLIASVFHLNADVGVRRGGGVRLHVMSGVKF